jgi:MYXO-CTERM domain-containing protein
MRSFAPLAFASFSLLAAACSPGGSSLDGPVGSMIAKSAAESRVPADLMVAIAHVEGGLKLAPVREVEPDELVAVAGVLELRRGRFNSLARGAELTGASELDLQRDLALGTRAGARVLADLAGSIDRRDLAAWAPIVEQLSGHVSATDRASYRARVFAVLRAGGEIRARGGEIITIAAHEEIPIELTIAPPAVAPADVPEFAGAIWFDTPQANKWTSGRGGNPVTMIAIHDTEGGWDASVATLQNDSGKSVHYIVDADGSRVGQFIHEADTGWHAGNWYYNQHMVGIEHVGYASNDDYQTPMYETSAKLVRDIAKRQGLGPNGDGTALDRKVLVGHQEVPDGTQIPEDSPPCPDSPGTCVKSPNYGGANNHRDPGVYWEWCQYMEMIGDGATCKCNDAYSHFNCFHDMSGRVKCDGTNVVIDHCANQSCEIMPVGVDDVCGQEATTSSSTSADASASASAGSGGSGGAGVTAGAGGGGGSGGSGGHQEQKAGCAIGGAGSERDGIAAVALAMAAAAVSRRRRRS